MKNLFILIILVVFLTSCKKSSVEPANSQSYFVEATVDGEKYIWRSDQGEASNKVDGPTNKGWFMVGADNNDEKINIGFVTIGGLDGKPKVLPISYGYFTKNRFEIYNTNVNLNGDMNIGSCTITKVNNYEVEGIFYYDAYNEKKEKISIINGRFKLKFY
ncbi:hypothetical protein [Siphonobacter sp. SORGH_AS_1065]|uniref:hypothetical protein n=1 Tax=Siphonobacter sp. SORGH_AS_1065 TaxID=3041795 RepID=UPI00277E4DFB|nr:hypothetical protein [Siphonobacter sp. SORGH_AS_1065]MDQ1089784.1 major membrane immunogen (membrane-anchored lipoprotein) [Siphonobacter sp. SORGH_AS_1065]